MSETSEPDCGPLKEAADCIDPLNSAAKSILDLALPSCTDTPVGHDVLALMQRRTGELQGDYNVSVEKTLSAQMHLLHAMFTQAAGKYAKAAEPHGVSYAFIALKSQSYYRKTVDALQDIRALERSDSRNGSRKNRGTNY